MTTSQLPTELQAVTGLNVSTGKVSLSRPELLVLISLLKDAVTQDSHHPLTPSQEKLQKLRTKLLRKLQATYTDKLEGGFDDKAMRRERQRAAKLSKLQDSTED